MHKNLIKQGDWFHFQKRVPKDISHIDNRRFIRKALKTKSEEEAVQKAAAYNKYIELYFEDIRYSGPSEKEVKFEKAMELAKLHGFQYKPSNLSSAISMRDTATLI